MLIGTFGVMQFGNTMYENIDAAEMTPRGEKVKI